MKYSNSTSGFYDTEVHGSNIPNDAVEISEEIYTHLLTEQSVGKKIVCDSNGYPVLVGPYIIHDGTTWIPDLPTMVAAKSQEIINHCNQLDTKPFEYPEGSGVFYKVTNAIKETIDFCELSGCVDTDPLPVNGGNWDNIDGTISTPMTVAELKALYIHGYGIPAHNYSNMKAHIATLKLLAGNENVLPEEIGNYDYSTGWR
ncbi:MAG: hypothetical protein WBB23_06930 [Desulforhopalus sp.]